MAAKTEVESLVAHYLDHAEYMPEDFYDLKAFNELNSAWVEVSGRSSRIFAFLTK